MKRLEFKEKLDEIYSKIEESEDEIRRHIRLIEDQRDNLGSLADSLENEGFEKEENEDEGNGKETNQG